MSTRDREIAATRLIGAPRERVFTMWTDPDGVDYKNTIVYDEIVRPERLVSSHVSGPVFQMTATFAAQGDATRLDVRMLFESAAQRDKVVEQFGAVEGLEQTLDRLEGQLAKARMPERSGR